MKLLGKVRQTIRQRHYSHQTEKSYIGWIKRYVLFQNKRHPKDMGKLEIEAFLTALANDGVAATTQNQAFNAIMFLYNQVLDISMKDKNIQALRTKRKRAYPCYLIKRRGCANFRYNHQSYPSFSCFSAVWLWLEITRNAYLAHFTA